MPAHMSKSGILCQPPWNDCRTCTLRVLTKGPITEASLDEIGPVHVPRGWYQVVLGTLQWEVLVLKYPDVWRTDQFQAIRVEGET